jgi:hypothetical protein
MEQLGKITGNMKKIIFLLLLSLTANAQRKNLIAEYAFDTEVGPWPEKTIFNDCSAVITPNGRKGSAVRLMLVKGEGNRAELGTSPNDAPKEGWYGFSLLVPQSYEDDVLPESVVQWQSFPDKGENWRSAPLFIGIMNGSFILEQRTDSVEISTGSTFQHKRDHLGAVNKGKWTDFVVHARWSYKGDGFLEVWKDDSLVFTKKGPTAYNDKLYPYFKAGPYKWDFTESKIAADVRVLYVDEVRIGSEKATYFDVWPGRKLIKTVMYYSDGTTTTLDAK